MANYYAAARTNYFEVKDPGALKVALADLDVELLADDPSNANRVVLLCHAEGGWPNWRYDEEADEDVEVDLPALVSEHLVDGHVAVFLESGAEKLRAVTGYATGINNRGDRVDVSLSDIYELAKGLGSQIDRV